MSSLGKSACGGLSEERGGGGGEAGGIGVDGVRGLLEGFSAKAVEGGEGCWVGGGYGCRRCDVG